MTTEFEFITNLKNKASKFTQSKVRVGIGDDCAVLTKDSKTDLVITTDLLIEDIDFRLKWAKPEFIGHKALAVSLSDIAAMGAKPVWAMLSIGIPEKIWKTDFVEKFYDGWFRLADEFKVELVGGDVSKTPDKIVIDSIVAGETRREKAVLRSGAQAGDMIFVTGELGGASAGLELLEKGIIYNETLKTWQNKLIQKQLEPYPRVAAAKKLGTTQIPTSMIDLSDGLSSDLRHICQKNQLGAKLFAEKIPFNSNLHEITSSFDEILNYALNGGEDFELLFTVKPKIFFQAEKMFKKHNFSHIGEMTANAEIIELIKDGKASILEPKGFRHF